MLVIRMQRTGRKGHAQFRVVVQDSRRTPTSGKVVANLGHFNPHTKETSLNKEKASFYLEHGAQPSERVARLLRSESIKLPKWVETPDKKSGKTKNVEKRRSTRPPEPKAPEKEGPVVAVEADSTPPADIEAVDQTEAPEASVIQEANAESTDNHDLAGNGTEKPADLETVPEEQSSENVAVTEENTPETEENSEKTKEA